MTDLPLVSVVIPVFEGQRFLPAALKSIKDQTYSNIEIVIVDGGSSAASLAEIRTLAEDVDKFESLPSGTPVQETWTRACELSSGEFVKLLCQDDVIYPDAIASQVAALKENPSARMLFSKRDIIDARGKTVAAARGGLPGRSRLVPGNEALMSAFLSGSNIFGEPLAVLFTREAVLECMPWDASIPYLIDMSTYTACMHASPVVYQETVSGAFRVSSESWSTRLTSDQARQFREWQRNIVDLLGPVPESKKRKASFNAYRVSWTRAAAYAWLRLTNRL